MARQYLLQVALSILFRAIQIASETGVVVTQSRLWKFEGGVIMRVFFFQKIFQNFFWVSMDVKVSLNIKKYPNKIIKIFLKINTHKTTLKNLLYRSCTECELL